MTHPTHLHLSLAVIAALSLSACGGGGGSSHTTPDTPTTHKAIAQYNQHALPLGNTSPSSISVQRPDTGLNTYQANPDNQIDALNAITINGTRYTLAKKGDNDSRYNYQGSDKHNALSSGCFLSYSRFALLNVSGLDRNGLFVLGQSTKTKDMPVTGKAHYQGYGVHQAAEQDKIIATDVDATVDFTAKSGTFHLVSTGQNTLDLNLNGTINGNRLINDKQQLDARFYGPAAAELVGSYAVAQGQGVFGTSKAKQK